MGGQEFDLFGSGTGTIHNSAALSVPVQEEAC